MRLGIYGGSFDPPHLGHLLPVLDASEALGLSAVYFIPAALQPFKTGRAVASAEHRLAMTVRLVHGVPGFAASATEVQRSGLSFTVDTLVEMAGVHPSAELVLLLGSDAYALFEQWRAPDQIRRLASIAILARGGVETPPMERAGVQLLNTRRVDISSTELRARVGDGRTIHGFVPDAVAEYIAAHRLYR